MFETFILHTIVSASFMQTYLILSNLEKILNFHLILIHRVIIFLNFFSLVGEHQLRRIQHFQNIFETAL